LACGQGKYVEDDKEREMEEKRIKEMVGVMLHFGMGLDVHRKEYQPAGDL